MTEKNKIICPQCDEQGFVRRIRIIPLKTEAFLCDECDAFWLKKEDISLEKLMDFTTFLESRGLDYNTTDIEILE